MFRSKPPVLYVPDWAAKLPYDVVVPCWKPRYVIAWPLSSSMNTLSVAFVSFMPEANVPESVGTAAAANPGWSIIKYKISGKSTFFAGCASNAPCVILRACPNRINLPSANYYYFTIKIMVFSAGRSRILKLTERSSVKLHQSTSIAIRDR
ncbi:Uncharacterised protein [uncultured archaeon]|nr:Uncharacterised protein [uncultured archaeon]